MSFPFLSRVPADGLLGSPLVQDLGFPNRGGKKELNFALPDGGHPLRVEQDLRSRHLLSVCDLTNGATITEFQLEQGDEACASDVCGSVWVGFTERGKVVGFDLLTGKKVFQIQGTPPNLRQDQSQNLKVHFDGSEVAVWDGEAITIYDARSQTVSQRFPIQEDGHIVDMRTTPNFLVYRVYKADVVGPQEMVETSLIRFRRRSSPTASPEERTESSYSYLDGFGSYIVCGEDTGKIEVFQNDAEGFLLRAFELSAPPLSHIRVYKNLLCIEETERFNFWDLPTRDFLYTIPKVKDCFDFVVNASEIFAHESFCRGTLYHRTQLLQGQQSLL